VLCSAMAQVESSRALFPDAARVSTSGRIEDDEEKRAFECNICYELAREPVVTLCGHLYCWPCIYRWMQVQSHCRVCPVCKAGIDDEKVVPIYGRGGDNTDQRTRTSAAEAAEAKNAEEPGPVPRRPAGQRPVPVQRTPFNAAGNMNMQPGLGIIPTLFGLQQGQGQGGYAEPLTPEQQHQAFLSRLLLMLGSFVIMCLLLF